MLRVSSLRVWSVCLVAITFSSLAPRALSPDIVISQVYGGGGNSGATYTNDFIELHNRGMVAVDVTGWTVQYASAAGSTWQTTPLVGTIAPGSYFLIQEAAGSGGTVPLPTPDATGTIAMSATSGKVAVVRTATALSGACPTDSAIADLVGFGTANCSETAAAPALSNTTAAIRRGAGSIETDDNSADFAVDAPTPRNNSTSAGALAAVATATPATVGSGDTVLLTAAVTPATNPDSTGITVRADLTAIGGGTSEPFFDDGTSGDVNAGDNLFSLAIVVAGAPGSFTLPVSVADAQGRVAGAHLPLTIRAPSADVVISQVYGGGGNSGALYRNDFIELRNREAFDVSVAGWSVQYASAAGTSWAVTTLSGTIPAGGYYLVQQAAGSGGTLALPPPDATGTIAMSAASGKVALVSTSTPLTGACPLTSATDFVGYGSADCAEGDAAVPALANDIAALRLGDGSIDTNNNAADFERGAANPRSSIGIPPTGLGAATPAALASGGTALLMVAVTPGAFPPSPIATVTADLTALGSATVPLLDDGSNGDAVAGDRIFSRQVTVMGAAGFRIITATIADERGRQGTATIRLAVEEDVVTPIAAIQGDGSRSPLVGQFITTPGIVTARRSNGFFIQTPDGLDDLNPETSEGLFVFTGSATTVLPAIGDAVRVSANVVEFEPAPPNPPLTELGGGPVWNVTAAGQPLPAATTLLASFTSPSGGHEQLERFEGMRVRADLTVVAPTDGTTLETEARAISNGEFSAVIAGLPRPVREPGLDPAAAVPPGLPCCVPRFDGNPERLRVDSDGQTGAPLLDLAAGQRLLNVTGVLDYAFGRYTILPDPGAGTIDGAQAATPVPDPNAGEFTVASFNFERFFDEINDPDTDDPVLTADALARRLEKASLTIRRVLRLPDVLGAVEVENLAILQRLAERVNADAVAAGEHDPRYAAYLEEGNDIGGIDSGFLVKRARVDVVSVEQIGKLATYTPPDHQPGTPLPILNDRPPLVLEALVHGPIAQPFPITVIVNHLRSLSGIDGSDGARIRAKRRAQAEFLAGLIQERQASERVIAIGDFNAFQFSDGLVDVMGTVVGSPAPPDQVALASADLVDPDLTNLGSALGPTEQHSFVFDGNAQALDHIIINSLLLPRVSRMVYARSNADFPESLRGDATRPERLSDHDAAVAYFSFPGAPVVDLVGGATQQVEAYTTYEDPGATAHDDEGSLPVLVSGLVDVNMPGDYTLTYTATNGYLTTTVTRLVKVRDTIAPAIGAFSLDPRILWPPNHRLVDVTVAYTPTDASGTAACSLDVTSNERGPSSPFHRRPDWVIVDDHHVRLRAEWSGLVGTRVYTVTATCADPSGNTASESGRVFVPGIFVALPILLLSLL